MGQLPGARKDHSHPRIVSQAGCTSFAGAKLTAASMSTATVARHSPHGSVGPPRARWGPSGKQGDGQRTFWGEQWRCLPSTHAPEVLAARQRGQQSGGRGRLRRSLCRAAAEARAVRKARAARREGTSEPASASPRADRHQTLQAAELQLSLAGQ